MGSPVCRAPREPHFQAWELSTFWESGLFIVPLRTKSLPFMGAFLVLEILPYKNKIGNAKVNLLSMSALLLALKILSWNRTFEFPGLHVWICSLIALRHGRVWHRFSCFVFVLICFVHVKAFGKTQLKRSGLFCSCFNNDKFFGVIPCAISFA